MALFLMLAGRPAHADEAFYRIEPADLHGPAGGLIRAEPLPSAPDGAAAYRILFRSTGLHGERVAVSAIAALPQAQAEQPVIVWAHPTSGVAQGCAPSLRPDALRSIAGLDDFLARGYAVVAPDYPGLGTPGIHPYLIGQSEGHALLDAARAVRALPGSRAGRHILPFGYSQGGHAALFAGTLARHYAPELELAGIAALAPPTELGTILRADQSGRPGRVLSSYALWSWSQLFGIPLDSAIAPHLAPVLQRIAGECSESLQELFQLGLDEAPFEREGFLRADVTVTQPWRGLIETNTPGITPPGVPVFIAQGGADTIVPRLVTSLYVDELCTHKVPVRFVVEAGAEHTDMPGRSTAAAVGWIHGRLAGEPAPDDCGQPR